QRVVERGLLVSRCFAFTDDQGAIDLKLTSRKVTFATTRHNHGTRRDATLEDHRLGPRHVDDGRARCQAHLRTEHRAGADQHAPGDDAARADKRTVFDDDWPRAWRLQHAANADAAGQVNVPPNLRPAANRGPRVNHRPRANPRADVDVAGHH